MALLAQDVIVTLICAGALVMVVRRVAGAVRPATPAQRCASCQTCSTAEAPQAPEAQRPMMLLRSVPGPSARVKS